VNAFSAHGSWDDGEPNVLTSQPHEGVMIIKSLRASTTGFAIIAGRGILISLACRRFASTFGTGVMIRDRRDRVASSANSLRLLTTSLIAIVTPRLNNCWR
jgi:hypothetical protein